MERTTYVTGPRGNIHSNTIILLHGRDSVASEFAEELFESQASDGRTLPEILPTIKWMFPTSQIRRSSRFDSEMSQWFDMWSVENPSEKEEVQISGLKDSIEEIMDIIRLESSTIPAEQIILGGISQGCAVAILALLCGGIRLGGFIGLCSWLPFQSQIASLNVESLSKDDIVQNIRAMFYGTKNASQYSLGLTGHSGMSVFTTPVFLSHSQDDDVVPIENGRKFYETLEILGLAVCWKSYEDGGHWINEPSGVNDIVDFIRSNMPAAVSS